MLPTSGRFGNDDCTGELEKHLFHHYNSEISGDLDEVSKMLDIYDPKELAIHMANGYHRWLEKKVKHSTDQYLKMIVSSVWLMDMYRLFCLSVWAGDAVMIEWLYCRFLPIYLATGKHQYIEIVLGQMEIFFQHTASPHFASHTVQSYSATIRWCQSSWHSDGVLGSWCYNRASSKIISWAQQGKHYRGMN